MIFYHEGAKISQRILSAKLCVNICPECSGREPLLNPKPIHGLQKRTRDISPRFASPQKIAMVTLTVQFLKPNPYTCPAVDIKIGLRLRQGGQCRYQFQEKTQSFGHVKL